MHQEHPQIGKSYVVKIKIFTSNKPLYIFFYNIKEMSEFCKSVKLGRFINKNFCKVMCSTSHYSVKASS